MVKARESMTPKQFVESGALTEELMNKIIEVVEGGATVLVAGETGTGKTTILNLLIDLIAEDKKISVINDYLNELNIKREDNVSFTESGSKEYEVALEGEPDMLIVNEVYGPKSAKFVNALLDGPHGMTTIHSESAEGALERIYTYMPEDMSHNERIVAIKDTVDLIIVTGAFTDGTTVRRDIIEVKKIAKDFKKLEGEELYLDLKDL